MKIHLAYGRTGLEVEIPDRNLLTVVEPKSVTPIDNPESAIEKSLQSPIGSKPLPEIAKGRKNACIVVSDITRPVPNKIILPPIISCLLKAGIRKDDIAIIIATGIHRASTDRELEEMLGQEILENFKILMHDGRDLSAHKFLGKTKIGTPVYIDGRYCEADLKILTGLIEPHFMAGYSGGRKSVCPGLASIETVAVQHGPKFLESPSVDSGIMTGNPFHEEAFAVAKQVGADFIVNVTINDERKITRIFGGDLESAHLEGVEFVEEHFKVPVKQEADIVVTSSAGYPLDATYYQTTKGMVCAMPAVKKGGSIIIASECSEGVGSREFVKLMKEFRSVQEFMRMIERENFFVIDQWGVEELCKAKRKADVFLFSENLKDSGILRVETVSSVEGCIESLLKKYGEDATITVIPKGPYVIPYVGKII